MAEEGKSELLPVDPKAEWADSAAFWASVALSPIPVLGTAVSHVLTGWSQERQKQRVKEVLEDLYARVSALGTRMDESYIGSDEFEDLLDRTLRQVTRERSQDKRRLYSAFLAGAIESPGEPYHEQVRLLRTIDELQPDHMRIIRAMRIRPSEEDLVRYQGMTGSPLNTLARRLPEIPRERLTELVRQLHREFDLLTLDDKGMYATITRGAAEDLSDRFTRYGKRLVAYIVDAEEAGA